jgi:hypothetical protein
VQQRLGLVAPPEPVEDRRQRGAVGGDVDVVLAHGARADLHCASLAACAGALRSVACGASAVAATNGVGASSPAVGYPSFSKTSR